MLLSSVRFIILACIVILTNGISFAQNLGNPPVVNWHAEFGGDDNEIIREHISDLSGNIYCTGNFSGPVNIGSFSGTSNGFVDVFLTKVSPTGDPLWFATGSSSANAHASGASICFDSQNNIYITGFYDGPSIDFSGTVLNKIGLSDAFIAKYNSSGVFQSAVTIGNAGKVTRGVDIETDAAGNIYLVTSVASSITAVAGSKLTKYSPSYAIQWNLSSNNIYTDIVVGSNQYFLTGTLKTPETFGTTVLTPASKDAFLAHADLSGTYDMAVIFTHINSGGKSEVTSISKDALDNIYMCGYFEQDLLLGSVSLTAIGQRPTFLAKFTASGICQWVIKPESPLGYSRFICNLCLDNSGNPILSGGCSTQITWGTQTLYNTMHYCASFNPSGNLLWLRPQPTIVNTTSVTSTNEILQSGNYLGNGFLNKYDQNYIDTIFSVTSSGNTGVAMVIDMVNDNSGNTYSAAYSAVSVPDYNNIKGNFIVKQSPSGSFIWAVPIIGGTFSDAYFVRCIGIDKNNNILVQGTFDSLMTIGNVQLTGNANWGSCFLAKISPDGAVLWARMVYSVGHMQQNSIISDFENNVIISGTFYGQLHADGTTATGENNYDIYIIKYNSDGICQWLKVAGGADTEYTGIVSCDNTNNIYLCGEFISRNIMINGYPLTLTETDGDVVLAKLSPSGTCQLAYAYGNAGILASRHSAFPTLIATLPGGQTYVFGWTGQDNSFGTDTLHSPYNTNFFLAKFSNLCIPEWSKIIKEKTYDYNHALDVDSEGNCYIASSFTDTLYFQNQAYAPLGRNSMFVSKYTSQGNVDWVKGFANTHLCAESGANRITALAVYDTNRIFIGGSTHYVIESDNSYWSTKAFNGFIALLGDTIITNVGSPHPAESEFAIYPNPGTGQFTVKSPDEFLNQNVNYTVHDMLGNIVYHGNSVINGRKVFDLRSLAPGNYYLRFFNENHIRGSKFTIISQH
ncbi:MAG: T9SS type A sorting domain-containing protein [Bacteroidota bacterium]